MKDEKKTPPDTLIRCPWCTGDALYQRYHDEEWGIPVYDDQKLFELLLLEGMQAGLSWLTILRRREGYRLALDNMRAEKIARYDGKDIERLMQDSRIIRNRRKIQSLIKNAQSYLNMMEGTPSFSAWLWDWVDGKPVINHFKTMAEIPASTELSQKISRELKKRGFSFVGPVSVYAFMQSMGMVNDHLTGCFCRDRLT